MERFAKNSRAHYLYATALLRAGGQEQQTIRKELREAIALDPRDARAHAALGQTYLAAGQADAAARELEAALRIAPEDQTALYQMAMLYRRRGNAEAAEAKLKEFARVKDKAGKETAGTEILRIVRGREGSPPPSLPESTGDGP